MSVPVSGEHAEILRLRGALAQIIEMADRADSPTHSAQGRMNAWAGLGDAAVRIARAALESR